MSGVSLAARVLMCCRCVITLETVGNLWRHCLALAQPSGGRYFIISLVRPTKLRSYVLGAAESRWCACVPPPIQSSAQAVYKSFFDANARVQPLSHSLCGNKRATNPGAFGKDDELRRALRLEGRCLLLCYVKRQRQIARGWNRLHEESSSDCSMRDQSGPRPLFAAAGPLVSSSL
jgi:hypothetical protein